MVGKFHPRGMDFVFHPSTICRSYGAGPSTIFHTYGAGRAGGIKI